MNLRRVARTRRRKSNWLSYTERRVDALALRADERRDKLRKASGEEQISFDPEISEWGNLAEQTSVGVM